MRFISVSFFCKLAEFEKQNCFLAVNIFLKESGDSDLAKNEEVNEIIDKSIMNVTVISHFRI